MTAVLLVLIAIIALIYGAVHLDRRRAIRDDHRRKRDLEGMMAGSLYDLRGYDILYERIARQFYRDKFKGRPREDLQRDLRLILEMKNALIEEQVFLEHANPCPTELTKRVGRINQLHHAGAAS